MLKKVYNLFMEKYYPGIIRFLLFITKGEIIYITLAAVITIFIVVWTIASQNDVKNVIDLSAFPAVVLESVLVAFGALLRKVLLNRTEDPNKLTNDYQKLLERYSSEKNFIWNKNSDGVAVIPIVHVEWLFDKTLVIEDHPENKYNLPDTIGKYYEELFSAHPTSRIYNNTNIRVDDWKVDQNGKNFIVQTGRTSFYNSLVTNRVMDYKLTSGLSVRELLECGPMVHPLRYSALSNHLGFNGFVESSDGEIMFVYRSKDVSIGKRTYADSVGASLKTKYALNDDFLFTLEGLENGIVLEIEDELGIPKETLEKTYYKGSLESICLISAYRDMIEGGKPQLLFYAKTSMTREQINVVFNKKNRELKNAIDNSNRAKNEKEMKTDGDKLCWLTVKEVADCDIYANKIRYKDKGKDKELSPMMPSASACVVMLTQFLKNKDNDEIARYSMPVTEISIRGKFNDENKCEDAIFCGKRFVAVIDGVTSKGTYLYNGKTSGKYASDILVKELSKIDYSMERGNISPQEILEVLDNALTKAMSTQDISGFEVEERLRASVIIFDRNAKQIINYGDCQCRIGKTNHSHLKKIDLELAEKRAQVLSKALKEGKTIEELLCDDIGRKSIMEDLIGQLKFENKLCEYGYPVLNGTGINVDLMRVYSINAGERVILCTDGYPFICETLEESERRLSNLLESDPLLMNDYKSTKGIQHGAYSFDDRAWVRIG